MSLGGTYQDHYKDVFREVLLHEAQQAGSRLEATVMVEAMEGNKTFFDKMGKSSHYVKTARAQDKVYSDLSFERRQVQEQFAEFDHIFDREDLIKYVQNPQSELVRSAVYELGRRKDEIIMSALSGNAVVTTNGSTANQAITNTVAVNNHSFDAGSGNVGLTTGKLKLAITILMEQYGISPNQRIFCVGPARQIMNLSTEDQQVSSDYIARKPLEGPGIVQGLSGFMGVDFIAYEETGVDGSDDELVYVYTDDAIKMGIFTPLTVDIDRVVSKTGNPDGLSVYEAIGATRMYEEKVVQIACNPLAS